MLGKMLPRRIAEKRPRKVAAAAKSADSAGVLTDPALNERLRAHTEDSLRADETMAETSVEAAKPKAEG